LSDGQVQGFLIGFGIQLLLGHSRQSNQLEHWYLIFPLLHSNFALSIPRADLRMAKALPISAGART